MNLNKELKKLAKDITKLYSKEIQRKGLVDTGSLKNSFQTTIRIKKDLTIEIDVKSNDYFQYIDEEYSVTEDLYESKAYKKIEDKMVDVIVASMFIETPKDYDSNEGVEYTFKFSDLNKQIKNKQR